MSVAVATKELNFASKREKAVSASAERIEVPPQNGSSFSLSQTIDLRLPSGMARGHYLDMQNSYVKLAISCNRAVASDANDVHLPRNGIYNLIQKVEILSSSATLSVIEDYHKLCNIFLDSECDAVFKLGFGQAQFGMDEASVKGQPLTLSAGTGTKKTTFAFPLILTNLASSSKYLPLFSNDNIIIRLTLASRTDGLISGNNVTDANSNIIVNPVSMICNVVKLDAMAQSLVDEANGGVYTMILDDYRNAKSVVAQTDRSINANLGFSNQSLSRVLFAFYNAPTLTTDSQGDRPHRSVSEYTFQLNGKNYPAQKIKVNHSASDLNISEAIAEIRASTRQAMDFGQANDITLTQFNTDDAGGRAFYEIDLEGLRSGEDTVYSGLYTVGGTTSLEVSMNADGNAQNTLNVFAQYQGALTLDTNGSNVFTYSV
jgi:hypothetical protein